MKKLLINTIVIVLIISFFPLYCFSEMPLYLPFRLNNPETKTNIFSPYIDLSSSISLLYLIDRVPLSEDTSGIVTVNYFLAGCFLDKGINEFHCLITGKTTQNYLHADILVTSYLTYDIIKVITDDKYSTDEIFSQLLVRVPSLSFFGLKSVYSLFKPFVPTKDKKLTEREKMLPINGYAHNFTEIFNISTGPFFSLFVSYVGILSLYEMQKHASFDENDTFGELYSRTFGYLIIGETISFTFSELNEVAFAIVSLVKLFKNDLSFMENQGKRYRKLKILSSLTSAGILGYLGYREKEFSNKTKSAYIASAFFSLNTVINLFSKAAENINVSVKTYIKDDEVGLIFTKRFN